MLVIKEFKSQHEGDDQSVDLDVFDMVTVGGYSIREASNASKEIVGKHLSPAEIIRANQHEDIRYNIASISGDPVLRAILVEAVEAIKD